MDAGAESCIRLQTSAGDVVHVHATGGDFSKDIIFYNPAGTVLCADTIVENLDCTTPNTATYTISVRDHDNTHSGTFTLWVQRLNNPVDCSKVSYGVTEHLRMDAGAESCIRLQTSAGDVVHVHATGGDFSKDIIFYNPAGTVLCADTIVENLDCTTPNTATYTISVRDHDNTHSGEYAITTNKRR
jgi:hypothetical protein